MCKGRPQGWWMTLRGNRVSRGWGHLVCSAWRRGDWGKPHCGLQFPHEGKRMGRHWSLCWPVTGLEGMAWSCIRGGFGWISGKDSSPRGCLGTGTASPGQWSQHQAWQNSRSVWTTFSGCDSWDVTCRARSWIWLSLVILMDPFQLSIFCDSVILGEYVRFCYNQNPAMSCRLNGLVRPLSWWRQSYWDCDLVSDQDLL